MTTIRVPDDGTLHGDLLVVDGVEWYRPIGQDAPNLVPPSWLVALTEPCDCGKEGYVYSEDGNVPVACDCRDGKRVLTIDCWHLNVRTIDGDDVRCDDCGADGLWDDATSTRYTVIDVLPVRREADCTTFRDPHICLATEPEKTLIPPRNAQILAGHIPHDAAPAIVVPPGTHPGQFVARLTPIVV